MRAKKLWVSASLVLVMVVVGAIAAFSQSDWVAFDGSVGPVKPEARIRQSTPSECVIDFQLDGFHVEEIVEEGRSFHKLSIPHYHTTLEIGKPALPTITELIGIPDGVEVKVSVVDYEVKTFRGYHVFPVQRPLAEGKTRTTFDIDREMYAADAIYPKVIAEVGEPGRWRDLNVIDLHVYPVRYRPAVDELIVLTNVTVRLEYSAGRAMNVPPAQKRRLAPDMDRMYRNTILNYEYLDIATELPLEAPTPTQDYDLLIIADESYMDELQPLVPHKAPRGISTVLYSLQDIDPSSSASEIKDFIKTEYQNHNISYVLLVGDLDDIPSFTEEMKSDDTWGTDIYPCDFMYSLMDGSDDEYPDIAVGRFSVENGPQVTQMVDKTISYETGSGTWKFRALLVASKDEAPGRFQECSEIVRTGENTVSGTYRSLYVSTSQFFTTAYGAPMSIGGDGAVNADVTAAIEEGHMIVNYRGHGSSTAWSHWSSSGEDFDKWDANSLDNEDRTPVVFSFACSTNAVVLPADCLGEAFLKNDEGAVAFFGAPRVSYTSFNNIRDQEIFAAIFDEGTRRIGAASNVAAVRMLAYSDAGWDNAKMFFWLGDPSLRIESGAPRISHWLLLIDISSPMNSDDRLKKARQFAGDRVDRILMDPDDQVAMATFGGGSFFNLLCNWTRDETTLKDLLSNLTASGTTPLADAICAAGQKLIADVPVTAWDDNQERRLVIVTAGGENSSTGDCSGSADPEPNPPWCNSATSWHCNAWTTIADSMVIDTKYLGTDPTDTKFLIELAAATGGEYEGDIIEYCGDGILQDGEECEEGHPCSNVDGHIVATTHCDNCQCVGPQYQAAFRSPHEGWPLAAQQPALPCTLDRFLFDDDDGFSAQYEQGWTSIDLSGRYGDYAGIVSGADVLMEDGCQFNHSKMWAFFVGSPETYACGGHPEQSSVPPSILNEIWSPMIDLTSSGPGNEIVLQFDAYNDLQLNNLVTYWWSVRSLVSGRFGPWRNLGYRYYGDTKGWITHKERIGSLIESDASHIQIALGVSDMCGALCGVMGSGSCRSHAPLFDNVMLLRSEVATGPRWNVRDIDLFQDTFPEDGTITGTGRADTGCDTRSVSASGNDLGDSVVVTVNDFENGIGEDSSTGFGPAVYAYVTVRPPGQPHKSGTELEEDPFRWPVVGSVFLEGMMWDIVRMDTVFAAQDGTRSEPVAGKYCVDFNDDLFEPGDTVLFFFGAENDAVFPPITTYWSEFTGTIYDQWEAAGNPMEFQVLPGGGWSHGGSILYVNAAGDTGVRPYFDSAFKMLGILGEVDRYDVRGPSSLSGNGLGTAVRDVDQQLIECYETIIWGAGELRDGTIGDGTAAAGKVDDFRVLYDYLDRCPSDCGVFMSGDDLAEIWSTMDGPSAVDFKTTFIPHAVETSNHREEGFPISPLTAPSHPWFTEAFFVYGGCPYINDFDVITPLGTSQTGSMYIGPDGYELSPAMIFNTTTNGEGGMASVVLSGFSFHHIADDEPSGLPDRVVHLREVLEFFGQVQGVPVGTKKTPAFINALFQNRPNPCNPGTKIQYSIKEAGPVSLRVYNVAGQLVRTLVDEPRAPRPSGFTVSWDGRDASGNPVASGVYFYRLTVPGFSSTKKLVVVK